MEKRVALVAKNEETGIKRLSLPDPKAWNQRKRECWI
ncbi:MAG: hypothetical protein ACJAVK_003096 [Akkermansiaceae bacterium]|jgi:hypothetical protein